MTDDRPTHDRAAEHSSHHAFLGRSVLYPTAYSWFVFLAALDIMMTWIILHYGGQEMNKLAALVIFHWQLDGMIVFRFVLLVFVVVLCEVVGRRRYKTGRRLAWAAVIINTVPVLAAVVQLLIVHYLPALHHAIF